MQKIKTIQYIIQKKLQAREVSDLIDWEHFGL